MCCLVLVSFWENKNTITLHRPLHKATLAIIVLDLLTISQLDLPLKTILDNHIRKLHSVWWQDFLLLYHLQLWYWSFIQLANKPYLRLKGMVFLVRHNRPDIYIKLISLKITRHDCICTQMHSCFVNHIFKLINWIKNKKPDDISRLLKKQTDYTMFS